MITWGISANSHNGALAVFDDNRLVFASETERFSGRKNDPHLNQEIIRYAADNFGGYPDTVCWYEKPWLKTMRQLTAGQGWLWSENNINKYLRSHGLTVSGNGERCTVINYKQHHHSHAAAGYYTSKFDNACVLVIDAIGEFETISVWQGQGNRLKKIWSQWYPDSVGLWYSAMTDRIGLKPNEEEYILMGMSAFGDPDKFTNAILNDFVMWNEPEATAIGFRHNLHRGCRWWRPELNTEQHRFDIAAGTQKVYEIIFRRLLQQAQSFVSSKNLVLMGGCALNCAANKIAYEYFDNVWIMPAPGDNGSAIGAVLAHKQKHIEWPGPYLGYDMGEHQSNQYIVDYLKTFKICGLARGRAEFGPRALGNRSLIADPRGPDIKEKVNDIKHRERFRPFAPAILAEHAHEFFDIPNGRSSDYMQMVYRCRRPDLFPAIVHHDGTSRLQTVQAGSGQFRELLELWYEETGCPMLLNTSLNIKGQPMVNTLDDAELWTKAYGLPILG
jgi:carbamoyltransferase